MQPNRFLENYYNDKCDEASRLLTRHGSVEFLTTMRYIKRLRLRHHAFTGAYVSPIYRRRQTHGH